MTEITSSLAAAAEIAAGILTARNAVLLDPNPASPSFNNVPVQNASDRNYTDLARLTERSARWCMQFGQEIEKAAEALDSADAQTAGGF